MRRYIHMAGAVPSSHLLQLQRAGKSYRLVLLHAEDEAYHYPKPTIGNHAHPDLYHLCLYTGGKSRFLLHRRLHPCGRGTLVVTSPGDWHDFGAHEGGAVTSLEFTFTMEAERPRVALDWPFHELLAAYTGVPIKRVDWPVRLDARQVQEGEHLCDMLLSCLSHRDDLLWFDIERRLLDLFGFLAHEIYGAGGPSPDMRDSLAQARELIEVRSHERLRLADLARTAGMSSGHFSRAFKARYAVSPIAYQLSLRIRGAKTLLRSGGMRIGEIAGRVGFPDIYSFSRMFRRIEGVSPSDYRQRVKRTGEAVTDSRTRVR